MLYLNNNVSNEHVNSKISMYHKEAVNNKLVKLQNTNKKLLIVKICQYVNTLSRESTNRVDPMIYRLFLAFSRF